MSTILTRVCKNFKNSFKISLNTLGFLISLPLLHIVKQKLAPMKNLKKLTNDCRSAGCFVLHIYNKLFNSDLGSTVLYINQVIAHIF